MNDKILRLVDELRNHDEVEVWPPADEVTVRQVEERLGVTFTPSYVKFVETYGNMRVVNSVISGIVDNDPQEQSEGAVLYDTMEARRRFNLPDGLAVIVADEEEICWCLDLRDPTVNNPPVYSYDVIHKKLMDKPLFTSFDAFFEDFLVNMIKIATE